MAAIAFKCLYMADSYLFRATAQVVSCERDPQKGVFLRLSQTIFHPQGGGQRYDLGTIAGKEVTEVKKEKTGEKVDDFDVLHYVKADENEFTPGQEVELLVDENRRRLNVRLHSAGHLIAAVVERLWPGIQGTNAHHFPKEARVEFQHPQKEYPDLNFLKSSLQSEMKKIIDEGHPVEVLNTAEGRQLQYPEARAVPCGGTHVKNTSEIGEVTIRDVKVQKGVMRIGYGVSGE